MRASLLIAAHNEGEALWKTIRSCVEATAGLDHEIVVADDASTDSSVEEASRRFPQVRVVSAAERLGASPTKHAAAVEAQGEVLVFLDGHTHPEGGSLRRLVEDVEALDGNAIVTPAVPHLDPVRWLNSRAQVGHGYSFRLDTLECGWVPLNRLTPRDVARRRLYETPALIGCALAIGRGLYQELWGFDSAMRSWGVEDIDFGLKAWLLGYPVLHDPQAIVGHRFRQTFDNYDVPPADLLANQLRFARKHFTSAVWSQWVEASRLKNPGPLPGHPEGLWARAWSVFEQGRESVEQERHYLHSRRTRDEFEYAAKYELDWPQLAGGGGEASTVAAEEVSAPAQLLQLQPSPSPPPPPCGLTGVSPDSAFICVGHEQEFVAQGNNLEDVEWTADNATPATGKGPTFKTKWTTPQANALVFAKCGELIELATVKVVKVSFDKSPIITGFRKIASSPNPQEIDVPVVMTVEPNSATGEVEPRVKFNGESRFEITDMVRDEGAGTISFQVGGQRETPENKPEGDGRIEIWYTLGNVQVPGSACGVPVVVAVPRYFGIDYPEADQVVSGKNDALGKTDIPPVFDVPAGKVQRLTLYIVDLTIQVVDQFKNPLSSIYDESLVQEQFPNDDVWRNIRQKLKGGEYTDPVGDAGGMPGFFSPGDQEVTDWKNSSQRQQPVLRTFVQNIGVKVGGHEIMNRSDPPDPAEPSTAIKNRSVTLQDADGDDIRVIIDWPSP